MMTTPPMKERMPDVPSEVFGQFLQALGESGVSPELVTRLRKALLEDKKFTERMLRNAVLGEESQP